MKRYDVCALRDQPDAAFIILQTDVSSHLETCIVAPLVPRNVLPAIKRMRPMIRHSGTDYVVALDRLAAVRRRSLRPGSQSLASLDYEIKAALDFLFFGF
jgi:hypothetical protein